MLLLSLSPLHADDTIEVAIFPYLSVHQLLGLYEPLRQHMEEHSGKPVRLVTSRDFNALIEDVNRGDYTLLLNAPHMARLAELDAGYRAILRPVVPLYPVVVVESEGGIHSLADLRGSHIATPYDSAIITMMGRELLREAGLEVGRDVHFVHAGSHNNAVEQMLNGPDVRAAIISNPAYGVISARYQGRVHQLLVDRAERGLPPLVYLAGPQLDEAQREALAASLLEFANHTEAGQAMMQRARHDALRRFDGEDRANIDPFIPATREAFALP